jgi:hypothetical protein
MVTAFLKPPISFCCDQKCLELHHAQVNIARTLFNHIFLALVIPTWRPK